MPATRPLPGDIGRTEFGVLTGGTGDRGWSPWLGEDNDGKLWAIFDDLYPVVNLDRPMSRSWLSTLLSGAYPFFYPDESTEGAYFYDASKRSS